MSYLWLTTKSRKTIMKDSGFYSGKIDSAKDDDYLSAVEKVNKKYLPVRFQKKVYYKETDIVLRNLRRMKESGVKNFKLEEFKCGCGRKYCSGYPVVMSAQLLKNLQTLREKEGPITITCGVRCQKYNDSLIGSIPNSKHVKGKAADIYIKGKTDSLGGRREVIARWKRLPGYGYAYCNENGNHPNMGNAVHVDVR